MFAALAAAEPRPAMGEDVPASQNTEMKYEA